MRSVPASRDDLTGAARIRNAAVAHFARDGFQKANLRAIATEAGVSVGLIFHHFDSKDGLRRACDEYVLQLLTTRSRAAAQPAGMPDLLGIYLSDPEQYQLHVQYLARAIQEDAPNARTIIEAMVDEAEALFRAGAADGTMHASSDPRALAVLNIVVSIGVLTMPPALARTLGSEHFGPDVLRRLSVPTMELYCHGLYADDSLLRAAEDAWKAAAPNKED